MSFDTKEIARVIREAVDIITMALDDAGIAEPLSDIRFGLTSYFTKPQWVIFLYKQEQNLSYYATGDDIESMVDDAIDAIANIKAKPQ